MTDTSWPPRRNWSWPMGKLEETEWLPSTVEDTRDLRDPKTVAKDLHTEEGDEDKE